MKDGQAWHELKEQAEARIEPPPTWTNLSALEEDFVLINHEHLRPVRV